jgi:uncharacterized membrane protein YdjX (TVP38/TMEM64 family)
VAHPITRRLPFILILVAAVIGAIFLRDQLSFETLAQNREMLLDYRDAHFALTAFLFVLIYIAIVALSLPGATIATLTGGFLFGLFPGALFNVLAAGTGAVLVYLAARAGLGADVSARIVASGGAGARLLSGLQKNVWSALMTMRLIPAVPFFLSNLLPAFAGVALWPFAVTTYLGIVPGTVIFTSVGAGLAEVFAAGGTPDLGVIFTPAVLLPLLGLAALSALPLLIRTFGRKEP